LIFKPLERIFPLGYARGRGFFIRSWDNGMILQSRVGTTWCSIEDICQDRKENIVVRIEKGEDHS
jgi:hypothetical protein